MELYTSYIGSGASRREMSQAAYALVRHALRLRGICDAQIIRPRGEKPYLAERAPFFSVSHSRGRVMAGISDFDLGVDIELVREAPPQLDMRLFSESERRDFTFFEAWTLRESVYKLTGRGSLRTMRLEKRGSEVITPFPGVKCRTYFTADGFCASCAAFSGKFPAQITEIPPSALF